MRLKLSYQQADARVADIVVTVDPNATVGEVAEGIAATDPQRRGAQTGALTLSVAQPLSIDFTTLDGERRIGEVPVASGYSIRILTAASAPQTSAGNDVAVVVRVTSGPSKGQEHRLAEGSYTIGRDASSDIVIDDTMVSKRHARLDVRGELELVDLNSANGLLVDGGLVPRLMIQAGQPVTLGESSLSFLRTERARTPHLEGAVTGGALPFNRAPQVDVRYPGTEYPRPTVPGEVDKQPFPWLLMVAPIMLGVSMYLITNRLVSLLFVAMTPLMMTGNYVMTRNRQKRQHESSVAKFEAQLDVLESTLADELPREQDVRRREAPSVEELLAAGAAQSAPLFGRRPEHWSFLNLRLGTGTVPSRNSVAAASDFDDGLPEYSARLDDVIARHRLVSDVPLTEDPMVSGAIGVVGDRVVAASAARGLLVQLAALHSPSELAVTAMTGPGSVHDFDWLKWLPHVASAHSPLSADPLADSASTVGDLVSALEELIEVRTGRSRTTAPEPRGPRTARLEATGGGATVGDIDLPPAPPLPVVLLLITDDAPGDRTRMVQVLERGAEAGIVPIWIAGSRADLPGACRTFVDVGNGLSDASVGYVRHGLTFTRVDVEGVSQDAALRFSRGIAALVDSGAVVEDSSDLPRTVTLLSLIGPEMAQSHHAIVDRWRQNESIIDRRSTTPVPLSRPRTLQALVGQAGSVAMQLDLRLHGPHALVAGTTGSGKSEFLQSWLLGLAAEHSPDRLTFLFVDYKGGAAFADHTKLPHSVGLVTDLTPHLVTRALVSLRAELHTRERLLKRKKAKDLFELEKRGDPECPPSLVLVVDEFAALATEVPDFVAGVVDIAQRGRSLGIHLIMATQRPAGVIKDNIRANTNLRVALRMSDEMNSTDVVGSPEAAFLDPTTPGRGLAKTGPGRPTPFQSAYAGGWTPDVPDRHEVLVHLLRFGAEIEWELPDTAGDTAADPGPTDQVRLVACMRDAASAAGVPVPRRPWLDELPAAIDLVVLAPVTDAALVIGLGDRPDLQSQDTMYFRPDLDGNLAVYGTGGSGKTVLLRTLAASAAVTPHGGPVDVYGIDFASGGLQMLEELPHVGSVIAGDDAERVIRLLRTMLALLEERSRTFAGHGSIAEYRAQTGDRSVARVLLLLDGYPAFKEEFDGAVGRSQWYGAFLRILSEGRKYGIHVVFTADRPGAVPSSVTSSVPRRVVLRLADESMYSVLDVSTDVLGSTSSPGRAVVDGIETQVAVLGGKRTMAGQTAAIAKLADALPADHRRTVLPILSLATEVPADSIPDSVGGRPVLGISDEDLEPIGFAPQGVLLVGGGPGSGRTNALRVLSHGVRRAVPRDRQFYLGNRTSVIGQLDGWEEIATSPEEIAELAGRLTEMVQETEHEHLTIVVESWADFYSTPADKPLVALAKAVKRSDHLLIAESETSTWTASGPLFAEIRSARRGILLQPETVEGDTILRTTFPRVVRREFPVGRGFFVQGGKVVRVQLALSSNG